MAEQLPLFANDEASPAEPLAPAIPIPEPVGEELARLFARVLARILARPAEPPR